MVDSTQYLAFAARKAATRDQYIASILAAYQKMEQIGDEELMEVLQCSAADYYRLALCQIPNLHAGTFAERVRHIADYANASSTELASIIKQVTVAQAFADTLEDVAQDTMLKAARDRDSATAEDEAPDEEER